MQTAPSGDKGLDARLHAQRLPRCVTSQRLCSAVAVPPPCRNPACDCAPLTKKTEGLAPTWHFVNAVRPSSSILDGSRPEFYVSAALAIRAGFPEGRL
ncbi:hypothetical protein MTO96_023267 [Rhipicephalus appendiculatus]